MMRPALPVDLNAAPAGASGRAAECSMLARVNWQRVIAFSATLAVWPAIFLTARRFL